MKKHLFPLVFFVISCAFTILSSESCKHLPVQPFTPIDTTTGGGGGGGGVVDTTHHTPKHPCSPDSVYFVNDILPLITSNCSMTINGQGCHSGTGKSDDARSLISYATIMSSGYVKSGNPNSSRLYTSLTGSGENAMPRAPIPALTKTQDSLIMIWIKQGALNNQCDGACDTTNVTYSGSIWPIIETSCKGCHSGSAPSGSTSLTNYTEVLAQVTNGKLLGSVTYSAGFNGMPVSTKLSDCDINSLRIWIRKGAPNN